MYPNQLVHTNLSQCLALSVVTLWPLYSLANSYNPRLTSVGTKLVSYPDQPGHETSTTLAQLWTIIAQLYHSLFTMVPGECPNESGCEVFIKRVNGRNKTLICSNLTIGMQCQFLVSLWFVLWLHNKQLHKRSCLVFAQASKQAWGALRTTQFSQCPYIVQLWAADLAPVCLSCMVQPCLLPGLLHKHASNLTNKLSNPLSLLVSAKWIYDTIYSVHVLCKYRLETLHVHGYHFLPNTAPATRLACCPNQASVIKAYLHVGLCRVILQCDFQCACIVQHGQAQ